MASDLETYRDARERLKLVSGEIGRCSTAALRAYAKAINQGHSEEVAGKKALNALETVLSKCSVAKIRDPILGDILGYTQDK